MLKQTSGRSLEDRITFYYFDIGMTAIRQPTGEITTELTKVNLTMKSIGYVLMFFLGIALVKSFVLMPLIKNGTIGIVWYFIPIMIYLALSFYSIYIVRKKYSKELLKNHGAEHKVHKAYNKLKRVPTIEEANKFSRIERACGITIYSAFIISQLIGFIVYVSTGFVIPEILLFIIPIAFNSYIPFNLLGMLAQFLTTSEPDRDNIELAIAALSALETYCYEQNISQGSFSDLFKK